MLVLKLLMTEINYKMNIAETELESYKNKTEEDIRDVRQNIKDKVNKYIIKETGKRPVILPVIIEL